MEIRRQTVGITAGHAGQPPTQVDAYTMDTGADLAVTVWTYGASLVEVQVPDRDGVVDNVVLRLPELASYESRRSNPYLGSVMGRFCRAVRDGRFRLDGVEHELATNEAGQHIHGGPLGFDRYVWTADAARDGDELQLRLRLDSPDGAQGYPGAVTAECRYRVSGDGTLVFDYRATTTASTIVSLTNHAFWNLSRASTVDDHVLAVRADRAVVFDDDFVPQAGPPPPVANSGLDHRRARQLGGAALDNCFVLDDATGPAAELTDPATGRVMSVHTDQPTLGVYTGDHYAALPRGGICLTAGAMPDAPNRPAYPSARLDPGGLYRQRTVHRFGVC
ncbi:aldose epimerase family protein [Saccharopolyspora sp. SCSIO 74807]|uniref:aldose epimerase family protein n=1 Tax=Saccharopolyspora sp. SCSIO 74807 TaxID=3118084 RepID=UPI0030D39F53